MKPAASYARLSHTDDASEPNTDFQHKQNSEYLRSLGYAVADDARYTEPVGMRSGRKIARRPEMQRLQRDLLKYKAIAFFNFSRFSRSVEYAFEFMRAATKAGVLLYDTTTRRQISIKNASEFLVTVTQAGYAEYESLVGTERMTNAYARARANGWTYHRRAPLGLVAVGSRDKRHFEKGQDFPLVLKAFKLFARGMTPREVADELIKSGARIHVNAGKTVAYQEYHSHEIVRKLDVYKPFIDADLFAAARRRVRERTPRGRAQPVKHPVLMLSHILVCADCGRLYAQGYDLRRAPQSLRADYAHVSHYICPGRHKVAASKVDAQVWAILDKLVERLKVIDWEHEAAAHVQAAPPRDIAAERAELEKQLADAKAHLLRKRITEQDFDEFAAEIRGKLESLGKEQQPDAPLSAHDIRLILESAKDWRRMAESDPREFNLLLRDIFKRVTIKRDNTICAEFAEPFSLLERGGK